MTSIIGAIVGAVLGAVFGGAHGLVYGAVGGWLVVRSVLLERRMAAIEATREAAVERSQVRPPASSMTEPTPTPMAMSGAVAARTASEARPALPLEAGEAPAPVALHADAAAAAGMPAAASAAPVADDPFWDTQPLVEAAAPRPSRAAAKQPPLDLFGAASHWLFGGNTIVKVGVGILFVGLAFLAKFATEHSHVPVEFRLAAIGGVALLLLAAGWRLRLRRAGYAQVLQGGGIALLYLTLFVSFRFYGVLDAVPVFGLLVAVAALAAALAVLQDARALAVMGALGGFAAPLLVSTGSGNHVALFTYYLVLDLGIAAVAWHKTWRSLNLVGFFGTFVIGTAWGVLAYLPKYFASSEAFLLAFFLLFVAIMLMPARRHGGASGRGVAANAGVSAPVADAVAGSDGDGADGERAASPPVDTSWLARSDGWVSGSLLFGLPTVVFALQYGMVHDTPYAVALSAMTMAAFYVGLASRMRSRPQLGLTFDACLAIGIVLLTLVIPFALDARSTAGAWALEGAALVWLGLRQERRLPRAFGYGLLLLAGFSMLRAHELHGPPVGLFNAYLFNALLGAAGALAAAYFVQRHGTRASVPVAEAVAEPLLIGWATLWLLSAATLEIESFVALEYQITAWLVALSTVALLFVGLASRLHWQHVGWPTVGHAPLLGVAVLASTAFLGSPAAAGGWWAWPLAFAAHLAVLRIVAPGLPRPVAHAVHAVGVLVLAAVGALQGEAITSAWGDDASAWEWLGWIAVPAVVLFALPRPNVLARWPLRELPTAYRTTAAGLLAAGLLIWTVLANFGSDGSARPLPHVPLLNPLDLGIGIALLASASWLRGDGARALLDRRPEVGPTLLGIAAFVWLNAMLVRGFHHYGGVPYRIDAWTASLAVQTGITLLWTATALVLMWVSVHRSSRVIWLVGAGLLAAVVLKLLLVDLSGSGSVTRIVSFIGVGVLMLVIGYVAPLPARAVPHVAAP